MKSLKNAIEQRGGTSTRAEKIEFKPVTCFTCNDSGYVVGRDVDEDGHQNWYICPDGCEASKNLSPALKPYVIQTKAYACDVCQDRGVVTRLDVPLNHPQYGKMVACPANCEAVQLVREDRIHRFVEHMSNHHPNWQDEDWHYSATPKNPNLIPATLDGYYSIIQEMEYNLQHKTQFFDSSRQISRADYDALLKNRTKLMEAAGQFIDTQTVPDGRGGLAHSVVLFGYPGVGKTLWASVVVNELKGEYPVWYSKLDNVFRAIKAGYGDNTSYSYDDMLSLYQTFPILIIDEIRKNHISETDLDIFYAIIDRRYSLGLSTILTMNDTFREFGEKWGGHVLDRIGDQYAWFLCKGHIRKTPMIQE